MSSIWIKPFGSAHLGFGSAHLDQLSSFDTQKITRMPIANGIAGREMPDDGSPDPYREAASRDAKNQPRRPVFAALAPTDLYLEAAKIDAKHQPRRPIIATSAPTDLYLETAKIDAKEHFARAGEHRPIARFARGE